MLDGGPLYLKSSVDDRTIFRLRAARGGVLEIAATQATSHRNFVTVASMDNAGNLRVAGAVTPAFAFPYPPGR